MKVKKEAFRLTALAAAMLVVLPCLAEGNDADNSPVQGAGIVVESGTIENDNNLNINQFANTSSTLTGSNKVGIFVNRGATATFTGESISVAVEGDVPGNDSVRGIATRTPNAGSGAAVLNLGGDDTKSISISAKNTGKVYGIMAGVQGEVSVKTKMLTVDVHSDTDDAIGLLASNYKRDQDDISVNPNSLAINADNIIIRAKSDTGTSYGIHAMSGAEVAVNGNLDIEADNAIAGRGRSTVKINESGEHTVKLKGDIAFDYNGTNSGTDVDADITVNFAGSDSFWNGNAKVMWDGDNKPTEDKLAVSNLAVNLSNGAQWTVTETEQVGEIDPDDPDNTSQTGIRSIGINSLGLNNGVVNMKTAGLIVEAGVLHGSGGVINAAAEVAGDGSINTAQMQVKGIQQGEAVAITAHLTGVTADEVSKDKEVLARIVTVNENLATSAPEGTTGAEGGTATVTAIADEGAVVGQTVGVTEIDENGEAKLVRISEAKNTVTAGLQKIAAMNYLTFRAQTNDVSKRMGDLRSMPQSDGAWGRIIAGQSEYKSIHNTYQTLQIGADKRIGNAYLGVTASYTDGDGSLKNGSTDDKNYGLGLYGGWMGEDGQYVDVIVKRQKFESDFDLYNLSGNKASGSYDTWGTSASVEYGWRLGIANTGYYVEPQAEFMFGHLNGVGYKTSNGVHVKQDGIDSAVGRAGLAAGWVSPDKTGSAYIKASVLHDWEGDADTRTSKDGVSRKYTEEMGGTWGEFALGGTFNITKNLAAYGEVETTVGNPVRTTYQLSGGIRYSF